MIVIRKDQYKTMLFCLKIIPVFMAFSYLMNTVCAFLGVPW